MGFIAGKYPLAVLNRNIIFHKVASCHFFAFCSIFFSRKQKFAAYSFWKNLLFVHSDVLLLKNRLEEFKKVCFWNIFCPFEGNKNLQAEFSSCFSPISFVLSVQWLKFLQKSVILFFFFLFLQKIMISGQLQCRKSAERQILFHCSIASNPILFFVLNWALGSEFGVAGDYCLEVSRQSRRPPSFIVVYAFDGGLGTASWYCFRWKLFGM